MSMFSCWFSFDKILATCCPSSQNSEGFYRDSRNRPIRCIDLSNSKSMVTCCCSPTCMHTTIVSHENVESPTFKRFFMEFYRAKGAVTLCIASLFLVFGLGCIVGLIPEIISDRYARLSYGYSLILIELINRRHDRMVPTMLKPSQPGQLLSQACYRYL